MPPELFTVSCVMCGMPCRGYHLVERAAGLDGLEWDTTCDCQYWDHEGCTSCAHVLDVMNRKLEREIDRVLEQRFMEPPSTDGAQHFAADD